MLKERVIEAMLVANHGISNDERDFLPVTDG
jgi:phage tail protein X